MTLDSDECSEDGAETITTTWQPSMGIHFAQQSQISTLPHARHFSTRPALEARPKDMFPSLPPRQTQSTSPTSRVQRSASPTTHQNDPVPERFDSPSSAKGALQLELKAMTEERDLAEKALKTAKGISNARGERVSILEQELSTLEKARNIAEQEREKLAEQTRTLKATFEERLAETIREEQEKLRQDRETLRRNQNKHNEYVSTTRAEIDKRYEVRVKTESQKRTQDRARFRERVDRAVASYVRQLQSETELRVASANRGYLARREKRTVSYRQWKDSIHVEFANAHKRAAGRIQYLLEALDHRSVDGVPQEIVAQLTHFRVALHRLQEDLLAHRSDSRLSLHLARKLLRGLIFDTDTSPSAMSKLIREELISGPIKTTLDKWSPRDHKERRRVWSMLLATMTSLHQAEVLSDLSREPSEVVELVAQGKEPRLLFLDKMGGIRNRNGEGTDGEIIKQVQEIRDQNNVHAQRKAERIVLQKLSGQWTHDDTTRIREAVLTKRETLLREFQGALARLLPFLKTPTQTRNVRGAVSPLSNAIARLKRARRISLARAKERQDYPKHAANETTQRGSESAGSDAVASAGSEQQRTPQLPTGADTKHAHLRRTGRKSRPSQKARRRLKLANAAAALKESSHAEDKIPSLASSTTDDKAPASPKTAESASVRYHPSGIRTTSADTVPYVPSTKRMHSTWSSNRAGMDSMSGMLLARLFTVHSFSTYTAVEQEASSQPHDSEWESCSEGESTSSLRRDSGRETSGHKPSSDNDNSQLSVYSDSNASDSQTSAYALSHDGSDSEQSIRDTQDKADADSTHSIDITPLDYQIPEDVLARALSADSASEEGAWSYELYSSSDGKPVRLHYHTTFAQAEAAAANLLNESVLGFDLEWEEFSKPGTHEIKRCVSLLQLASESACHLFHIARWTGSTAQELMPPSLQHLLTSTDCIKAGVNVAGDAGRILRCFGVEMQGVFELSHMYRLVMFGADDPIKVTKQLIRLAVQVQQFLLLPLPKGEVRTSKWSAKLERLQYQYAASDAYAGFRLFHALDAKRRSLKPTPPRPAFWELRLPIELADGTLSTSVKRTRKGAVTSTEAEQEDGEDEFFDALETQEAGDGATGEQTQDREKVTTAARQSAPPVHTRPESDEFRRANAWSKSWLERRLETTQTTITAARLRAYHLWHIQEFSVEETAALLRTPPLASNTVASYVLDVIARGQLAYDSERLKPLVQRLPRSVQARYRGLVTKLGL